MWDVVLLHTGPLLHDGDEAIIGAFAIVPVLLLYLLFLLTVGRNRTPRRPPAGPGVTPTDTPGRPGSPS